MDIYDIIERSFCVLTILSIVFSIVLFCAFIYAACTGKLSENEKIECQCGCEDCKCNDLKKTETLILPMPMPLPVPMPK